MDYIGLTVKAVDDVGQDYKTSSTIKWITTEELPAPVDMDDALLEWYVADLTADIADVESQLTEATADEKVALEACPDGFGNQIRNRLWRWRSVPER